MSLDEYFSKMPHAKPNKIVSIVHASNILEPAEVEPNTSEVEASIDAEETGSNVNPSILSALNNITDNTYSLDAKVDIVLAAIRKQTFQIQALAKGLVMPRHGSQVWKTQQLCCRVKWQNLKNK